MATIADTVDAPPGDSADSSLSVRINRVSIYQAVEVTLMTDGEQRSQPNAPVVKGRPALVRVFVSPGAQSDAVVMFGRLDVPSGPKTQTLEIAEPSVEADLTTTFNFELTAEEMNVDSLAYTVSIGGPSAPVTRWPTIGTASMTLESSGASVKIVYVPFNLLTAGQGTFADISTSSIRKLDDALFAEFPTAKIESSVHAPMDYAGPALQPDGSGWSEALEALRSLRQRDHPATNVTYYGLVAPAARFEDYCIASCVGGVAAFPPSPTASQDFAALGVSYHEFWIEELEDVAVRVALQEIAHTFGRPHATCIVPEGGIQAGNLDPTYPYLTGSIGVWGYDMLSHAMKSPDTYKDIQSYCNPVWVSDYTYGAIFDWLARTNAGSTSSYVVNAAPPDASQFATRLFRMNETR